MEANVKYEVKELIWYQKIFLAKRAKLNFKNLYVFLYKSYPSIYSAIANAKLIADGMPCTLCYSVNEKYKIADVAAAVPVKEYDQQMKGFEKIMLPESKILAIDYHNSSKNMGSRYAKLDKYLKDHNLEKSLFMEEWQTNKYYFMK